MTEEGIVNGNKVKTVVSLLNLDGIWWESRFLFPSAMKTVDPKAYFSSIDGYYRDHHIAPPRFDKKDLDAKWRKFEHLKYPSSLQEPKWKNYLSRAF